MYQDFYGLKTDPFRLSPDHKFCLRHATFEKARAYMQFAVHRAEGFVMVTGRPGTGKTTLIDDVLDEIDGHDVVSAKLVSAQLEAEDLLRMTAFNFGIPYSGKSKSEMLLEMQGFFANCIADGQRPLLVIDEAQGLSVNALEELRLLTNLRISEQPMLQIFLVGQDELRDLVLDPRMEQLHQRLIASCHLEPLDFKQTANYVMHRMKVAGWSGNPRLRAHVFPPLYKFSQGVPRRINLFMGRLLLHGWLEEQTELTGTEAELIFEELKKEHLAPSHQENALWDRPFTADPSELDESLLMPDQKIGAKLIQKRAAPASTGNAEQATALGAASPPQTQAAPPAAKTATALNASPGLAAPRVPSEDPPPPTLVEKVEIKAPPSLAVDDMPMAKPASSAPAARPERRTGMLSGLLGSLSLTLLVVVLAALLTPGHGPRNAPWSELWKHARVDQARAQLYQWSNGALPLYYTPDATHRL